MRVPRAVASGVVYRLKEAPLRRHTLATLAELEASERLPEPELAALQADRLRRMVRHAYDHVPYYREQLDLHGVRPDDIRGPGDLKLLPVLTKDLTRERHADLAARGHARGHVELHPTSGSTGVPVMVPLDGAELSARLANQLRGRSWHGLRIGDPEVRVWNDPRFYLRSSLSERAYWSANTVKDLLLNIRTVAANDLSDDALRRWVQVLRRARPALVYGYAASIYFFARFLSERAPSEPPPHVGTVVVTAEKIQPSQKELIADVFGARVVEEYGCVETGIIAFECERGGLHTCDESVVVEVPDPGPDAEGEVLVTSLTNTAFPLIRYEVGDIAALATGSCDCGRALGLLDHVVGRSSDYFVDSRGNAVHPFRLMPHFHLESLERYRAVQMSVGHVEFQFQAPRDLPERDSAAIRALYLEALGADTQLRFRRFDTLPPGPRGKHRYLTSLVGGGTGRPEQA